MSIFWRATLAETYEAAVQPFTRWFDARWWLNYSANDESLIRQMMYWYCYVWNACDLGRFLLTFQAVLGIKIVDSLLLGGCCWCLRPLLEQCVEGLLSTETKYDFWLHLINFYVKFTNKRESFDLFSSMTHAFQRHPFH